MKELYLILIHTMKKRLKLLLLLLAATLPLKAQDVIVKGPDGNLQVAVTCIGGGKVVYSVSYKDKQMLENSPLGMETNVGDFAKGLKLTGHEVNKIDSRYSLNRIKTSQVHYRANELNCFFDNAKGQKMQITFRVSNNDVAFRYTLLRQGDTGSVRVMNENTGFAFPEKTTTFLCPQSDAMIGWKRTKPSYEEEYKVRTTGIAIPSPVWSKCSNMAWYWSVRPVWTAATVLPALAMRITECTTLNFLCRKRIMAMVR